MATQVKQYPRNADGTPLDLEVAVYTDDTGNNGQRMLVPVTGPDGAPIDAKAVIPVDPLGNILPIPQLGAIMAIAAFATASAVSVPLGTTMVNTNGYSVANDGGHAIYVNDGAVDAAYVAANPRTSFRTVNNRGFRLSENQSHKLQMFGGVGDAIGIGATATGTDNLPAFVAAFTFLQTYTSVTAYNNPTLYRGGGRLWVPRGRYRVTGALDPLYTGELYGDGGKGWGAATQIVFPMNSDGLRMQAHNTSGSTTVDGVQHFAGDNLIVSDIAFLGPYAGGVMIGANEGEFHGCRPKRIHSLYNCTFDGFQGEGYYAKTTFGGGAPLEGNTNVSRVHNCDFNNNRSGTATQWADANAIVFSECSYIGNRALGAEERSFLGCHYTAHFDANGRTAWNTGAAGQPVGYVHDSGHIYFAISGQEGWCSVNRPSTTTADNQGWGYWQDGAASPATGLPTWFNGIAVRVSGGILIDGAANASTVSSGSHFESNGINQIDQYGYVSAGSTASPLTVRVSGGVLLRNRLSSIAPVIGGIGVGGNLTINGGLYALGPDNFIGPNSGAAIDSTLNLYNTSSASIIKETHWPSGVSSGEVWVGYAGTGGALMRSAVKNRFDVAGTEKFNTLSDGAHATGVLDATGTISGSNLTTGGFPASVATGTIVGRAAAGTGPASALTTLPTPAMPALSGDISNSAGSLTTALGANVVTSAKFRQSAANTLVGNPTGGTANVQDITLAGGLTFSGTTLTAAGALTPTSVASSGAITSTGGVIGYAVGAGGTVVQATNKATAVTLNKLSGEITLNAANLAADTTVPFVFNNSFINANSILSFNHASVGSFGSYNLNAHGFASGSCTIDVRNVTPGALAEGIVLRYAVGQAPTT